MSKIEKSVITDEIDRRLDTLRKHESDKIVQTGNQYEVLNQALSHVIAAPLKGELTSLREFVESL